jgi:aryl-alcohol dehydrogenase-like predicted oxidoreductase
MSSVDRDKITFNKGELVMMKRIVGRIDTETSAVGMGCWAIGGEWDFLGGPAGWGKTDDKESMKAIQAAFDHGIRLFDTAANYGTGLSERLLGEALGANRKECAIATKFGFKVDEDTKNVYNYGDDMTTAEVISHLEADCEASLRRLNTDYIDVYLFHVWEYEKHLAEELREALERLVGQGKIRSYGWSTDDVESARLFSEGQHCSSVEFNFNVVHDNRDMVMLCDQTSMNGLNRGPLAMGFLTGKYDVNSMFAATDVRSAEWVQDGFKKPVLDNLEALREIFTSNGRSLAQGALAWIWARSEKMLPIPGIRTVAQAVENAKAMEFGPLTPEQVQEIDRILGR